MTKRKREEESFQNQETSSNFTSRVKSSKLKHDPKFLEPKTKEEALKQLDEAIFNSVLSIDENPNSVKQGVVLDEDAIKSIKMHSIEILNKISDIDVESNNAEIDSFVEKLYTIQGEILDDDLSDFIDSFIENIDLENQSESTDLKKIACKYEILQMEKEEKLDLDKFDSEILYIIADDLSISDELSLQIEKHLKNIKKEEKNNNSTKDLNTQEYFKNRYYHKYLKGKGEGCSI